MSNGWEPEMHLNETATESAWNANESREEQASWDEAGSWEAEDDQFEASFADEDEEETFECGRYPFEGSPCLAEKREKNACTSESNHA